MNKVIESKTVYTFTTYHQQCGAYRLEYKSNGKGISILSSFGLSHHSDVEVEDVIKFALSCGAIKKENLQRIIDNE